MFQTLLGVDTTRGDNPLDSNLAGDTKPEEQKQVASFLTVQSLTYSGAMTAIGVVWNFLQRLFPSDFTTGPTIPVVLSVLLVAAGFLNAWTDLRGAGRKAAAGIVAVFNAALLAAGALGISTALATASPLS